MREALFQSHEQPFVLRDPAGVIERDRSIRADRVQIVLLSVRATRNYRALSAIEAVVVDSRKDSVKETPPGKVSGQDQVVCQLSLRAQTQVQTVRRFIKWIRQKLSCLIQVKIAVSEIAVVR